MFSNFQIFTFRGIPIRVHGSLIVLLVLLGLAWNVGTGLAGFLLTLVMLALIFGFVLLHELGHSLVALRHGVGVKNITLYPLGGIASLARMPRDPRTEFQIAIAGPLVNIALAGLLALARWVHPAPILDPLIHVNLALALFNLLPAFPLDGGRIFRACLAARMSHAEATRIAARTGQAIAVILGFIGLFTLHIMLMLIAGFVFLAAQAELLSVLARSRPGPPWFGARAPENGRAPGATVIFREPPGGGLPHGFGRLRSARQPGARGERDRNTVIEVLPDGTVRRHVRR